ncbi:hypothetical protein Dimus_029861 [Dionaea muscipula]
MSDDFWTTVDFWTTLKGRADMKQALSLLRSFLSFSIWEAHLHMAVLECAESIVARARATFYVPSLDDDMIHDFVCGLADEIRSTLNHYDQETCSAWCSNRLLPPDPQHLKDMEELNDEWESEKSILTDLKSQLQHHQQKVADLQQKVADSEQREAVKRDNLQRMERTSTWSEIKNFLNVLQRLL